MRNDIASLVENLSAHLVSFKLAGGKRSKVLEVYADTEEGITAGHLADISRALSEWLDTTEVIPGDYKLVVSSPGLDNPLLYGWQYNRHKGRTVHIVRGDGEEADHLDGVIQGFDNDTVSIATKKDVLEIPIHLIVSAKIVPSLK